MPFHSVLRSLASFKSYQEQFALPKTLSYVLMGLIANREVSSCPEASTTMELCLPASMDFIQRKVEKSVISSGSDTNITAASASANSFSRAQPIGISSDTPYHTREHDNVTGPTDNVHSVKVDMLKPSLNQNLSHVHSKEVLHGDEKGLFEGGLIEKESCHATAAIAAISHSDEPTVIVHEEYVLYEDNVKRKSDASVNGIVSTIAQANRITCSDPEGTSKLRYHPATGRERMCGTEKMACPRAHNMMRIHVGHGGKLSRYKADFPIPWTLNEKSFLDHGHDMNDIMYVKECLQTALAAVNSMDIGITFTYVSPDENKRAIFTLSYQYCHLDEFFTCQFTTFAQAFLPGQQMTDAYLYELAFAPAYRHSITNILCHEIAHTLGMRHWNAAWMEAHEKSVQFPSDSDNSRSVMGPWRDPAEIHFWEEDKKYLKMFYSKKEGETIGGYEIEDIILTL